MLRGRCIALQAYFKKTRSSSNKHSTLHLKELEKEQPTKPQVSRRKEIISIRAETNKIESEKLIPKNQ